MLITNFQAQAFGTNCWILATDRGEECIVVDPGMPNVSQELSEKLTEFNLKPVAILVTHGHLDHTFSVQPIADGYGIPAMIHSADRELFLHPERAHGAEFIAQLAGIQWHEAKEVVELNDNQEFAHKMAKKAYEKFFNLYSADVVSKRLNNMLQEISNKKR